MPRVKTLTPEELIINHRASSIKYADKNREKYRAYSNNYYKENKEKVLAQRRARRERLKLEKESAKVE